MHNFVWNSNESACRKSERLGMEQVLRIFGYLKHNYKGKIYLDPEHIYYYGI